MRQPLSLAVAQPACVAYQVAVNALAHAALVRTAQARVVVFPELSLTGYELDAPAIEVDDPRLAPIVEACAESGSLALVGAPLAGAPRAGAKRQSFIALLAVDERGVRVAYRKLYLSSEEAAHFTPGEQPVSFEVDGWRLGLAICKDLWVPAHAARTLALGVDAYVGGTVKSADESRLLDERARRLALDGRVWVAIASFAGSTGGGYKNAAGRSLIVRSDGQVAAQAGPEVGATARATLR